MKDLILRNSEWLRREKDSLMVVEKSSFLVREWDLKKCCIGVLMCQEGIDRKVLIGLGTPRGFINDLQGGVESVPEALRWLFAQSSGGLIWMNSGDAWDLMLINDNPATTDQTKVELMKPIFEKHGFNVIYREDL